ncbi:S24 family peptidase [Breznakiella homolactica]|uniref:Peptidase S24/S26A/S26B/S26C domain-containing protein n=1 Tax=Breznakiella homolactica TaxID=2798577 RepID=A0A7T8BAK2_9SPIR|nr:S24 family peptidase [Breznakiella homolactica]QQO08298.1 hypothetical protein JFL75_15360 [Breznakiella homolactica]
MEKETGFPSPAQGYEAKGIDLNELLIKNPAAMYFMEMASREMLMKGVFPESLLLVDRSRPPRPGALVVIRHCGEFLCREMRLRDRSVVFTNGEDEIVPEPDTEVFGTVSAVIRRL